MDRHKGWPHRCARVSRRRRLCGHPLGSFTPFVSRLLSPDGNADTLLFSCPRRLLVKGDFFAEDLRGGGDGQGRGKTETCVGRFGLASQKRACRRQGNLFSPPHTKK
nr:hypothetical protein [Pandoravirus massiliensis]